MLRYVLHSSRIKSPFKKHKDHIKIIPTYFLMEDGTKMSMQEFVNEIYCGNHLEILERFPRGCIDLTVTSPPYDNIRDYDGYSFDLEGVIQQLYRVTKERGVVVWVVGDSFLDGNKSLTSFKHGIALQEAGFKMYDVMIYAKESPKLPHKRRYLDAFEYMFICSKGFPKTVNLIMDRKNKQKGVTCSSRTKRNKDGTTTKVKNPLKIKNYSRRYNIWYYLTGYNHSTKDEIAFDHPAMFPEKLARDHIYSWSNPGDVVLDPMCGSGTVPKMAHLMGRNYIGIDISEKYCDIARKRLLDHRNKIKPQSHWEQLLDLNEKERKTVKMDSYFSS